MSIDISHKCPYFFFDGHFADVPQELQYGEHESYQTAEDKHYEHATDFRETQFVAFGFFLPGKTRRET